MWSVDIWNGQGWETVEEGLSFVLARKLAAEYEDEGQVARWRYKPSRA